MSEEPELIGFWGPVTSSVDWCEPNYVWSLYVAEWWNTISNLFPIMLGVTSMFLATKRASEASKAPIQPFNVMLAYLVPIIVYTGSFVFHATLTYFGQLLDELPMIYGTLYLHYIMSDTRKSSMPAHICVVTGFVITATMILLRESPQPLRISHGALLVTLVIRSAKAAKKDATGYQAQLLKIGSAFYSTAFALWLIDQNMCKQVAGLYFHAWWHVLTGVGTYLWIQFAVCLHHSWDAVPHTLGTKHLGLPFALRSDRTN